MGLVKDGTPLQHKVQFVSVNQEDSVEETAMFSAWYEVLSVLHLMAALLFSQANLMLLPRTSSNGHQPKVSEGSVKSWDNSIDLVNVLKHDIRDGQLSFRGKRVLEKQEQLLVKAKKEHEVCCRSGSSQRTKGEKKWLVSECKEEKKRLRL